MGNFTEGFWDLFIIVCTLGGILALFLLTVLNTTSRPAGGEAETTGHKWDEDIEDYNNPMPEWWVNMFYITLLWGVLYLVFFPGLGTNDMLLGWTQVKQYEAEVAAAERRYGPLYARYLETPVEQVAADLDARKMGRRLFVNYCAQCHGSDAAGARGFPNLADGEWQWGGEPEAIKTSILAGRVAQMPGWSEALGGEQGVQDMVQHVLKLAGREHDSAAAARAEPKYQQICVACHGAHGAGNPQLGAPNLTDDIWLYGGSPGAIEASIAEGRQGRMPAHAQFLGEAKSHVLAAYVWGLSNP